jgi:hypothetical protein
MRFREIVGADFSAVAIPRSMSVVRLHVDGSAMGFHFDSAPDGAHIRPPTSAR